MVKRALPLLVLFVGATISIGLLWSFARLTPNVDSPPPRTWFALLFGGVGAAVITVGAYSTARALVRPPVDRGVVARRGLLTATAVGVLALAELAVAEGTHALGFGCLLLAVMLAVAGLVVTERHARRDALPAVQPR